ncbi:MAG: aspartyl protease family protein [Gemmatimonadales bacterium]
MPRLRIAAGLAVITAGLPVALPAQQAAVIAEIPFVLQRNKILVRGEINGRPLTLVFDTGSPPVVLTSPDLIGPLGLEAQGQAPIGGGGGGPRPMATITSAGTVSLGGVSWEEPRFIAIPLDTTFARDAGYRFDGIFGLSLLSRYVVEIDFPASVLRLYPSAGFQAPPGAVELPIWLENGHPHLTARIQVGDEPAREVELVVDTGASLALALARESDAALTLPDRRRRARIGHGVAGPVLGEVGVVRELSLGSLRVGNIVAAFPDPGMGITPGAAGNLGSDLLRRFRVTFDYAGKRMLLEAGGTPPRPFTWHGSGIRLRAEGLGYDTVTVAEVEEGSPAALAGIQPGDRIEAVDGTDAGALRLAGVEERFRVAPGETREARVTFRRNGVSRTVTVKLTTGF